MFWKCRILRQQFLVRDISTSYMWYSGAFPQSHARSAFCSDWWINCCVWRWGNCRCVSKGTKAALGRDGWPPTIPTTAPPRQLPTGWWSNLGNASCTACDLGVSASWLCARSGHHGGMWGKRWHTTWATVEQATKSEFSRCKWNHAPLCGSLQRKSQMCPSPARSWCQQRPSRDKPWINASIHSSSPWAPWSCQISGWVGCQQRPRPEKWWINASTRSSSSGAPWSCPISGWVGCQQRPKARQTMDQRLFSWQLGRGALKLSDFWWRRVPTKTKSRQTMEQRLFSLPLFRGTLKLSDFLVESGANKEQGLIETGSTPIFVAANQGHLEVVQFFRRGAMTMCRLQAGMKRVAENREIFFNFFFSLFVTWHGTTWNEMEWSGWS